MVARYSVKLVDMGRGERMPLLVDADGIGVFEATAFSLAMRLKGRKVNTITQALRAVQFLYESLAASGVDLMARAKKNDLLTMSEVEGLAARCRYNKVELEEAEDASSTKNVAPHRKPLKKNQIAHYGVAAIQRETAGMRLGYISAYLTWFSSYVYLQKIPENRRDFNEVSALVISSLKARSPDSSDSKSNRKGITKVQEIRLRAVVTPSCPQNPWRGKFLQTRNYLIVRLLLDLGIRKGELLGIKIEDISFRNGTIFIARRPDDAEDSRPRQPQTKTAERLLAISDKLAEELERYLEDRYRISAARKHPFVFVSRAGDPLALNSVDLLFSTLRTAFPELTPLAAHLLRHTWNDRFSEMVDRKMDKAQEQQIRNYLMGWSDESKMAANYTKRYVEQVGNEMSLKMQNAIYRENG